MYKLESDFEDYYDSVSDDSSSLIYKRYNSKRMSRAEDLSFLSSIGIQTVKFGAFRNFGINTRKFVVYLNPYAHDCKGKILATFDEVAEQHTNRMVAEFIEMYGGYTLKYVQIGERRFRVFLRNLNFTEELCEGQVVKIDEIDRAFNFRIRCPIFSIDYVSDGPNILAIDFNRVQNLGKLGFEEVISAAEVANEVEHALKIFSD